MPIFPRDAHQQFNIVSIELLRREIKFQGLRGLQFGIIDIALLNKLLSGFGAYSFGCQDQCKHSRKHVNERKGAHSPNLTQNNVHRKSERAAGPLRPLRVAPRFSHSFLTASSTKRPAFRSAASLRRGPISCRLVTATSESLSG